jgi:hypothetical protein
MGKQVPHIISDNHCSIADLGCGYQVRGGNDEHERSGKILGGSLASAGLGEERLARSRKGTLEDTTPTILIFRPWVMRCMRL